MADFLTILNEKTYGKYDFLRVKSVEVNSSVGSVTVTFLVPPEKYSSLGLDEQKEIKEALTEQLPTFEIHINFEKHLMDHKMILSRSWDFISKRFPFVACGLKKGNVAFFEENNHSILHIKAPESISEYAKGVGFEGVLSDYLYNRFCIKCAISWEVCEVDENDLDQVYIEKVYDVRSNLIPISNRRYLAGRKSDLEKGLPTHICDVKKESESVLVCGVVKYFDIKDFGEQPAVVENPVEDSELSSTELAIKEVNAKKTRKRRRYCYKFTLDDSTSKIKVSYFCVEKNPELDNIKDGDSLMVRGNSKYNELFDDYSINANLIARCEIDFEAVKEQMKKLPPPENYLEIKPGTYEYEELNQISFDNEEEGEKDENVICALAFSYVKIFDDNGIDFKELPYEMACIKQVGKTPREYIHSYLKVSDTSSISVDLKDSVFSAPRLENLIPDILKFIQESTVVVLRKDVIDTIFNLAESLRYEAPEADFKNLHSMGVKKGDDGKTFYERCADKKIILSQDAGAMSHSRAMLKFYNLVAKKK